MKKTIIATMICIGLAFSVPAFSQPKNLGRAAEDARNQASRNNWRNWLIAGGAIALAAIGLVVIGLHKDHTNSNSAD